MQVFPRAAGGPTRQSTDVHEHQCAQGSVLGGGGVEGRRHYRKRNTQRMPFSYLLPYLSNRVSQPLQFRDLGLDHSVLCRMDVRQQPWPLPTQSGQPRTTPDIAETSPGGGGQNHPLRTTALECLMLPPDGNRKRSSLRGVCPL